MTMACIANHVCKLIHPDELGELLEGDIYERYGHPDVSAEFSIVSRELVLVVSVHLDCMDHRRDEINCTSYYAALFTNLYLRNYYVLTCMPSDDYIMKAELVNPSWHGNGIDKYVDLVTRKIYLHECEIHEEVFEHYINGHYIGDDISEQDEEDIVVEYIQKDRSVYTNL